jgi:hypothetical protein
MQAHNAALVEQLLLLLETPSTPSQALALTQHKDKSWH